MVEISHTNAKPTVMRTHPTRPDFVALGLENGQVFFLKMSSKETYVLNAHEKQALVEENELGNYPEAVKVIDLAWDPMEDNFLVSFGDNSMCLVTFQGFQESTRVVKTFQ